MGAQMEIKKTCGTMVRQRKLWTATFEFSSLCVGVKMGGDVNGEAFLK